MPNILRRQNQVTTNDTGAGKITPTGLYHGWVIVAAGFVLVMVLYGAYYSFVGAFLTPIEEDLGWSRATYSGAAALYLIIHGIFAIIMGRICDKYGPRWIVASGVCLIAIGYGLISQVNAAWQFYIYLGLMVGIGMGAAYVPPLATVAKWFDARRGLALGVVAAGVGVGQIILPPLLKYFITEFGWRDSVAIMAVIICVLGIPAAFLMRNPPNEISQMNNMNAKGTQSDWSVKEAIQTPSFWFLLAIFAALVFGTNLVMAHLVAHVEDNGFDPVPAGAVLSFIGGAGIAGRIISGGAADRIRNRVTVAVCLGLQIIVFTLLIWIDDLPSFYVIGVLYGLGYGGTLPLIVKMSSEFFGTTSGATIFGIMLAGASVSGALGALSGGLIYGDTEEYTLAFIIAGAIIVMASVINLVLKPPERVTRKLEY
ncbi:MAG: MFS transporter [Chloroflexi bacterium]|jgi:MFS transporter, OFA family, oxalate/formate antiporter|nr:MFS transporter [Chloroflexota bacterium]